MELNSSYGQKQQGQEGKREQAWRELPQNDPNDALPLTGIRSSVSFSFAETLLDIYFNIQLTADSERRNSNSHFIFALGFARGPDVWG